MKIAIIGRPNVGKSSLFNRICKKRISIVDEEEGVTRDRLYQKVDFFNETFFLIDTAGIDFSKDEFAKDILKQTSTAIDDADAIIMVVDGTLGILDLDQKIKKLLTKSKKPFVLAVNKIDDESKDSLIDQFYSLGISDIIGISAIQGRNIEVLLEKIMKKNFSENLLQNEFLTKEPSTKEPLQKEPFFDKDFLETKVSIIGRANVGKSTLLNCLINKNRSLVSDIAGTTRDYVEEDFENDNTKYLLKDTAGIRRRHKERCSIEKFAFVRTKEAVKNSDICILVVDAVCKMTTQDKRILKYIERENKGCVIFVNKMDLIKEKEKVKDIRYPIVWGSCKTKNNIDKLWEILKDVEKKYRKKISTSDLNKFIKRCLEKYPPPFLKNKRLKIYYLTQTGIKPPRFCFFVNNKHLLTKVYKRYLLNQFSKIFRFDGIPITLDIKGKHSYGKHSYGKHSRKKDFQ